jgi:CitMHS family citrate-Mg2+:H+ or citrate-Ca2+:H+ symporter
MMGRSEARRLHAAGVSLGAGNNGGGGSGMVLPPHPGGSAEAELDFEERNPDMVSGLDPQRKTLRPNLIWFNLALTAALLVMLGMDVLPLPLLFMGASAIAIAVNFPDHLDQSERIKAHGASIVSVVAMVLPRRSSSACCRAPAWSRPWPTPSSMWCRPPWVPGSRSSQDC